MTSPLFFTPNCYPFVGAPCLPNPVCGTQTPNCFNKSQLLTMLVGPPFFMSYVIGLSADEIKQFYNCFNSAVTCNNFINVLPAKTTDYLYKQLYTERDETHCCLDDLVDITKHFVECTDKSNRPDQYSHLLDLLCNGKTITNLQAHTKDIPHVRKSAELEKWATSVGPKLSHKVWNVPSKSGIYQMFLLLKRLRTLTNKFTSVGGHEDLPDDSVVKSIEEFVKKDGRTVLTDTQLDGGQPAQPGDVTKSVSTRPLVLECFNKLTGAVVETVMSDIKNTGKTANDFNTLYLTKTTTLPTAYYGYRPYNNYGSYSRPLEKSCNRDYYSSYSSSDVGYEPGNSGSCPKRTGYRSYVPKYYSNVPANTTYYNSSVYRGPKRYY